jgi:hypothetical protein
MCYGALRHGLLRRRSSGRMFRGRQQGTDSRLRDCFGREGAVLDEVVAGILVDAIAATGRRLGAYALAGRNRGADLGIARWFDTYQLTADPPEFAGLSAGLVGRLEEFLQGDDMQAVLHELLAARLSDAPEADVAQIRTVFGLALNADLPDLASFGAELFGYYDSQICELVGRLEGSEPALLGQIRAEALSSRMIAILGAIELYWSETLLLLLAWCFMRAAGTR